MARAAANEGVDEGAAGENASLGELIEEFGASETVRTQYVIIAFGGFAVGAIITCVAWLSPEGGSWGNKLAGFIFLALGCVFVWGLWRLGRLRVRVYEGGVVCGRRGRERVFAWDEVDAFAESRSVYEDTLTGLKSGVGHTYSLRRRDGEVVTLDNEVAGVAELGAIMRRETGARLVPRAAEIVRGGGSVRCGEFVLTREGLAHKSKTLAWAEVGGVEFADGRLNVTDRAGRKWAGELHGFVPNAHVLAALIEGRKDFGF